MEQLKGARGWVEDEEAGAGGGIDARWPDGRGGDRGAQLELGHGRRKRKEERERERESRHPKGISEAGIRRHGTSSTQLADGDAWHAKMRALPLTRGKTGGGPVRQKNA